MTANNLHGVNLTGWLTLESWVTPELFAPSAVLDEPSLALSLGPTNYKDLIERHRCEFITQADFARIAARGFNAVRLLVPWYVFGNETLDTDPYIGCIQHVDHALDWAEEIGLKLIFVLAIAPGVPESDSVVSYQLSDLRTHRETALITLGALSKRYASRVGFFGIELAQEVQLEKSSPFSLAVKEGVPSHVLRNYYRDAYELIRSIAGDEPVVILPDGGEPKVLKHFMANDRYKNVWVDCQLSLDTTIDAGGPCGVRKLIDQHKQQIAAAKKSGMPVMVGSWSASLPIADSVITQEGRIAFERIYTSEQLALFQNRPAWFFQTWKTSGLLPSWDARVAFATFEREMIV